MFKRHLLPGRCLSAIVIILLIVGFSGCRIREESPVPAPVSVSSETTPPKPKANEIPTASAETTPVVKTAVADVTPEPPSPENPALASGAVRAQKIDNRELLTYGAWASGSLGDYLLENEVIRVIIGAPGNSFYGVKGGGHIMDVCLKGYLYDYIRGVYANINQAFPPNYTYHNIEIKSTGYPDNGAAIIVSGRSDPGVRSYAITTEYLLKPGKPVVEMTTSITNLTTQTLSGALLGDIAEWGGCMSYIGKEGVISRKEVKNLENLDWYGGVMDNFSMGITQKAGPIKGEFTERLSRVYYKTADIKPGEKASYTRYLVVSDKNFAKITDFAYEMREKKFGFVTGRVIDADSKKPISDVEARFIISRLGEDIVKSFPYTRAFTDANGNFEVTLPEGTYFISSKAYARKSEQVRYSFPVKDGESYAIELKASPTSKLKFTCRDKDTKELLPCKLTFINIPPTVPFDRGPLGFFSRNVYYSATGDETIEAPTGHYKVIFSRGMEYDACEQEIFIYYTRENVINAELKHIIDVPGYVSADVGIKTNNSYNCYITPEERVVAAAAEGVEYLVSGDTNQATDLSGAVAAKGLQKFVKTGVGKRLEFMGEKNLGNILVWPLGQKDLSAAKDHKELEAGNPSQLMSVLRSKYPDSLIQVDRAIFPLEGYFTHYEYHKDKKPVIEDSDFSYDFDLLDIWDGKRQGIIRDSLNLLFHTWFAGYDKIKPFGGSKSVLGWGEELGYPRVYIASNTDDPSQINESEILDSVRKGRYIITNGPIIKFTINGQPTGSLITDTDGRADCHLEIMAPPWAPTSYIDLNMDGVFFRRIIQPPSKEVMRFPSGRTPKGSEDFEISITKDSIITIEVACTSEGGDLSPVVPPHPYQQGGVRAFAITAPIFIDFDGNGKYDV
ncbi:hypothetical protein JW926_16330, partial [Candidatus Sumerlaeota bacterium]|nr:hypothetical protein [Candidatus Sumerlaeota bacterium]